MKFFKSIYSSLALAAIALLPGCQAQMNAPENETPVADLTPNTTLADLKALAVENPGELYVADADGNLTQEVGLRPDGSHYIIHGRMVSSDATGNIYKSLSIQDETAALTFSVNQRCIFSGYPLGQEIVVDLTGLYLGYYSGLMQVGAPGEPYNGEDQVDRMPWGLFLKHIQRNGLPNDDFALIREGETPPADRAYIILTDLTNLPASGMELYNMQSQLVEFRNVYFEDGGKATYSNYEESVNRTLRGVNGGSIIVRNSGYSNFYNQTIPEGTGTVRGILSYFGGSWQLVLRGPEDVIISGKGDASDPFTVADICNPTFEGISGWAEGYIVGSVKAGVSTVTSADQVIFGKDAEMDNNLLIAASADETDWTKCAVVELPQASIFRRFANLADNPEVYKRKLTVNGTIGHFLGLPGVIDNAGDEKSFSIEGIEVDPNAPVKPSVEPSGSGTESDPYNIGAIMAAKEEQKNVWVVGYVAGYVAQNDWTTAVFSPNETAGSTNYLNNTNVILTEKSAATADYTNSIPATLKAGVKSVLGLQKNPAIFGKRVLIKGDLTKVYDTWGIKNISEVKEL